MRTVHVRETVTYSDLNRIHCARRLARANDTSLFSLRSKGLQYNTVEAAQLGQQLNRRTSAFVNNVPEWNARWHWCRARANCVGHWSSFAFKLTESPLRAQTRAHSFWSNLLCSSISTEETNPMQELDLIATRWMARPEIQKMNVEHRL